MFCTECGKEINKEFKFCPHCGCNLKEALSSINTTLKEIEDSNGLGPSSLAKQFGRVEVGAKIYQNSKTRIREIGKKMGYVPVREYFFRETVEPRLYHKIDIVWKSTNGFAAAFNIKSKTWGLEHIDDLDQVMRLANFPAEKKYVVYVSKRTGDALFHEVTEDSIKRLKSLQTNNESTKAYDVEAIRQEFKRAYEPWNDLEDAELVNESKQGLTIGEMAEKHQRKRGAITSRLEKLEAMSNGKEIQSGRSFAQRSSDSIPKGESFEPSPPFTFLVKSQKNNKICLACIDSSNRWIRPIKPGGFDIKDVIMDNGKPIELFDIVELSLKSNMLPIPINRYKENLKVIANAGLKFVRKLERAEQELLVSRNANETLLSEVSSKEQLFDKLSIGLNQSLILVGPVSDFGIEVRLGENHPRIWIIKNYNYAYSLSCTDIKFCTFIQSKVESGELSNTLIDSHKLVELRQSKVYFVIGLTGDSLDENEQVKDGKWHDKYWPLIVSVLTVPYYSEQT